MSRFIVGTCARWWTSKGSAGAKQAAQFRGQVEGLLFALNLTASPRERD